MSTSLIARAGTHIEGMCTLKVGDLGTNDLDFSDIAAGERIRYVGSVPDIDRLSKDLSVRTIVGHGRTLMSGLGDAHTHFSWNNGDLGKLGDLGVEEHTLMTARSAQCYLDSGYTMCFGAASAKERLDCVIRDAINAGDLPGPRYLANGKEMAVPDGDLVPGITAFASGPLEVKSPSHMSLNQYLYTSDERDDSPSRQDWSRSDQAFHERRTDHRDAGRAGLLLQ